MDAGLPIALFSVALFLAGLVVASFVNTVALRWIGWRVVIPQFDGRIADRSALVETRALCGMCGAKLAPWGGGAISWVGALGRCRGEDRHKILSRYLWIELLTAVLWAGAGVSFGVDLVVVPVLIVSTGLVAMAAVDLWVMRIPNHFVYATHAVLIPSIVIVSLIEGVPGAIAGAAVGGVVYFLFLLLFHLISPRKMGFGDVRLAGIMGLVLGWLGWLAEHDANDGAVIRDLWFVTPLAYVIWGALLGSLLGTAAGIGSLVAKGRSRPFPFGPALAAGCLLVIFLGDSLIG